jgi:hypothetical protein
MTTVLASVSEIARVGGWALRGLGYPFGTAERAVRLLTWAEVVGCGAVGAVRHAEAAIEASLTAAPLIHRRDAHGRRVSATDRHLLEVGGAIVDLVSADARQGMAGRVVADGVIGFSLLPALANLLASRRLSGVLVYRAPQVDRLPDGFARDGWLSVNVGNDVEFAQGALQDDTGVESLLLASAGSRDLYGDSIRTLVNEILPVTSGSSGRLGVLATKDILSAGRQAEQGGTLSSNSRFVDYRARFAAALKNGVPMQSGDLDYLYALEMRTWAPTSERSRGQAGYGLY